MITKKARKYVEKKYGKAENHKIPKRVGFRLKDKPYEFSVRNVKGKKRWVRLPKVKKTSIDPLFADLGDLPGTYAELRM